jgi:hypothetical protein
VVAERVNKGVDLDSLIALVKQAADAQQASGVAGTSGAGSVTGAVPQSPMPLIDSLGFSSGLFPKDQVASDVRPRPRSGDGLNPVMLQIEEHDRERSLAVGLIKMTKDLDKSTAEAEAAQRELEAFRQVLERRVVSSMGRRSLRRGEYREMRNQDMDNRRDYWYSREREAHYEEINWRRVQEHLEDMRRTR